jgi:thioredoxin 1
MSSNIFKVLDDKYIEGISVLDFYADWCRPCKEVGNFIDANAYNYPRVKFYKVDVDDTDNESLVKSFGVDKIPRVIFMSDGKLVNDISGNKLKEIKTVLDHM